MVAQQSNPSTQVLTHRTQVVTSRANCYLIPEGWVLGFDPIAPHNPNPAKSPPSVEGLCPGSGPTVRFPQVAEGAEMATQHNLGFGSQSEVQLSRKHGLSLGQTSVCKACQLSGTLLILTQHCPHSTTFPFDDCTSFRRSKAQGVMVSNHKRLTSLAKSFCWKLKTETKGTTHHTMLWNARRLRIAHAAYAPCCP